MTNRKESDRSEQRDRSYFFKHRASLRIFGPKIDFDAISETLGVPPTHTHKKGDLKPYSTDRRAHDMWLYTVDVDREKPLGEHLDMLWEIVSPHIDFLKRQKESSTVDVFLAYTSNCDHAGIDVPHSSLKILNELEASFSLSIIVT